MYPNKLSGNAAALWLLFSLTAPITAFAGGSAWSSVLLACAVCGAVSYGVLALCDTPLYPNKWVNIAEIIWLTLYLGQLAHFSADCWKTDSQFPVIPLALILLAAMNAWGGAKRAAGVCLSLRWLVWILLGVVLITGIREIKPENLAPTASAINGNLAAVLLAPCLLLFTGEKKNKKHGKLILLMTAMAIVFSVLITGSLGIIEAAKAESALYEFSKHIKVFGVGERFEAMVSCALTVGWFSYFSFLMSIIGGIGGKVQEKQGEKWIILSLAVVCTMAVWNVRLPDGVVWACTALMWAVIPAATGLWKKVKKR